MKLSDFNEIKFKVNISNISSTPANINSRT